MLMFPLTAANCWSNGRKEASSKRESLLMEKSIQVSLLKEIICLGILANEFFWICRLSSDKEDDSVAQSRILSIASFVPNSFPASVSSVRPLVRLGKVLKDSKPAVFIMARSESPVDGKVDQLMAPKLTQETIQSSSSLWNTFRKEKSNWLKLQESMSKALVRLLERRKAYGSIFSGSSCVGHFKEIARVISWRPMRSAGTKRFESDKLKILRLVGVVLFWKMFIMTPVSAEQETLNLALF